MELSQALLFYFITPFFLAIFLGVAELLIDLFKK